MATASTSEASRSLKNHFLLAMPGLQDPFFAHGLAYILEHDEEGAMGLVVNRPSSLVFADILEQLNITTCTDAVHNAPILVGGPVDLNRGFVLHTNERLWPGTLSLDTHISLSTSRDVLAAIAAGEGPAGFLITLGYAGWGAGQLEQELNDNAWLTLPADAEILFGLDPENRARAAAARHGIDLDRLSGQAGHA